MIRRSTNPVASLLRTTRSVPVILLDRYIEGAILEAFVLVAAALTGLFSLLEFVDQLRDVGRGHYRVVDAFVYVLLTAPSRLLQLLPISMLLASLLALGTLSGNNELTAMRAAGISGRRIVGWILKLAGPIVVVSFLIAEFVIPPAQQLAQAERTSKISASAQLRSGNSFWAEGDRQYLNIRRFDHGNIPRNIDIYAFTAAGELKSFIHADRADVRPDGTWLLTGVLRKRFEASRIQTERLASLAWNSFLRPQQVRLLMLSPASMPPIALYQYVRDLKRQHQPAARYEQELWERVDIPLTLAAMIMIATPLVFGPLRTQSRGQRIVTGGIIGIVFSLIQQISNYLSLLFALNPALAATMPSLLLMALASYLFRRARL